LTEFPQRIAVGIWKIVATVKALRHARPRLKQSVYLKAGALIPGFDYGGMLACSVSHLTFKYFPLQYGRQISSRHESGAKKWFVSDFRLSV
jgi:hypothetical protein